MTAHIEPGATFIRPHPFTKCAPPRGHGDKPPLRWRPGAWNHEGEWPSAHAMGSVTFHVVSLHSPPRYPRRVFFTRRFTDPDGALLKQSGLLCKTLNTFEGNVEDIGFEYDLEADMDPVTA